MEVLSRKLKRKSSTNAETEENEVKISQRDRSIAYEQLDESDIQ